MPSPDYSPKQPASPALKKLIETANGGSYQPSAPLSGPRPAPARREYCMTPQEFADFQTACNPRVIVGDARLLQEHARRCAQAFWEKLGEKYGFDWTTTQPVQGKHHGFFTARPLTVVEYATKQ